MGFLVHVAVKADDALKLLTQEGIDFLLTDIHLTSDPDQNTFEGYEILKFARENCPELVSIIMSFDPKVETYKKAAALGAGSFIKKPIINEQELQIAILAAQERKRLQKLQKDLARYSIPDSFAPQCRDGIVLAEDIRKTAQNLARAKEIPCVIYGETGTGKEELSRLIHKRRVESEGDVPFVAVNCANIDPNLAVSQLFGHRKGAFTGADQASEGYISEANGGILFLDEIHCLSLECQRRLLRVLNDGTYQRLGDSKTLRSIFQVIVASTEDLDDLVAKGTFLLDLRTRILGVDICLKPLRERQEEINLLVPLFFARERVAISQLEMEKLVTACKKFYWQGNIRQLFKSLKTLVMMASLNEKPIKAEDLPVVKTMMPPGADRVTKVDELINQDASNAVGLLKKSLMGQMAFRNTMDAVEKALIKTSISRQKTFADAAAELELARSTFDMKRKQYNLI